MNFSKIIATGSYLPKKVLTNFDLEKIIETSDQWIVERTGIKKRHIAAENETSSTLAYLACQNAFDDSNITPNDIDIIIVATCTPDRIFPGTACTLQKLLNITRDIPAFDISSACAGFAFALSVADQFIKGGTIKTALVVGSEVMSRVIDWQDRRTCILFGDGAGAVILQKHSEAGIISTHLHTLGKYDSILYLPNDRVAPSIQGPNPYMQMNGNEVFKIAVYALEQSIQESLTKNNINISEVDWFIPHQANYRIIQLVAKKLQIPISKFILTIEEQGNTSAASIPTALDYAIRTKKINPGDLILLEGFGGGMSWGSALIKY